MTFRLLAFMRIAGGFFATLEILAGVVVAGGRGSEAGAFLGLRLLVTLAQVSAASVSIAVSSSVSLGALGCARPADFRASLEAALAAIVLSLSHQLGVRIVSVVASTMSGLTGAFVASVMGCLFPCDDGGETKWPFLVSTFPRKTRLASISSDILIPLIPLLGSILASLTFFSAV